MSYYNYNRYRDPLRNCLSNGYIHNLLGCGSGDYYDECSNCNNQRCKREIKDLKQTLDRNVAYLNERMYKLSQKILSLTEENQDLKEQLKELRDDVNELEIIEITEEEISSDSNEEIEETDFIIKKLN